MNSVKQASEDEETRYFYGLLLCMKAGAIKECKNHPGNYCEGNVGVEAALTQSSVQQNKEAIQKAFDDNSGINYCPNCEPHALLA